jgi:hypothetical protein
VRSQQWENSELEPGDGEGVTCQDGSKLLILMIWSVVDVSLSVDVVEKERIAKPLAGQRKAS